jgi:ADP-heptose:LPS heptosyltransferase
VTRTVGKIQWVQVGAKEHDHPKLDGAINLVGKTDHRQLIRLAWHARGGLGPVTYLQHLCAAWEKPYVCLLGGREPVTWVQYPLQHTLHTIGMLPCCKTSACWKSRIVPSNDSSTKDQSLCQWPVLGLVRPVSRCMSAIRPDEVITVLERYACHRS